VALVHCAGIDGGNDVDVELLTGIYERVGECEFKPGSDHVSQVMRIEQMIVGKKPVCILCLETAMSRCCDALLTYLLHFNGYFLC